MIRNGGHVGTVQKAEFSNTLMQVLDSNSVKKLNATRITNWLMEKGFWAKEPTSDGKSRRVPTAAGRDLGLSTQLRQSPDGEYLAIYYDANAQRFLLDHLYDVLFLKQLLPINFKVDPLQDGKQQAPDWSLLFVTLLGFRHF